MLSLSSGGRAGIHPGTLFVTTYRVVFVPRDEAMALIDMPLLAVEEIGVKSVSVKADDSDESESPLRLANGMDLATPMLKLVSKHGRRLYFLFDQELLAIVAELVQHGEAARAALQPRIDKLRGGILVSPGPKAFGKAKAKRAGGALPEVEAALREFVALVVSTTTARTAGDDGHGAASKPFLFPAAEGSARYKYDARAEYERQGALKPTSQWREAAV